MTWTEIQIDRIVGPTHHFGGLGVGNLASQTHAGQTSNPAAAALQGLEKMRLVASLGAEQFVLPPQPRPDFWFLRSLGFEGDDQAVLDRSCEQSPVVFSAAMSSSAMWTANAATVTKRAGSPILTIANLSSSLHRAIEPNVTLTDLRHLLPAAVEICEPLVGGMAMRDEGAANHMRLCCDDESQAIDVFVFGDQERSPRKYLARQTRASFEAIARRHRLSPDEVSFVKQHPDAIDAGAFHNDVVAMSHRDLLIHHQDAFADPDSAMPKLEHQFAQRNRSPLDRIEVSRESLSLADSVSTYLFNSQIISSSKPSSAPIVICPSQVFDHAAAKSLVDGWVADGHFSQVVFVELGQSMSGGGGPACLRLRVPMLSSEVNLMNGASRWSEQLHESLAQIIRNDYPTSVTIGDLRSLDFVQHACRVRDRIAEKLGMR